MKFCRRWINILECYLWPWDSVWKAFFAIYFLGFKIMCPYFWSTWVLESFLILCPYICVAFSKSHSLSWVPLGSSTQRLFALRDVSLEIHPSAHELWWRWYCLWLWVSDVSQVIPDYRNLDEHIAWSEPMKCDGNFVETVERLFFFHCPWTLEDVILHISATSYLAAVSPQLGIWEWSQYG